MKGMQCPSAANDVWLRHVPETHQRQGFVRNVAERMISSVSRKSKSAFLSSLPTVPGVMDVILGVLTKPHLDIPCHIVDFRFNKTYVRRVLAHESEICKRLQLPPHPVLYRDLSRNIVFHHPVKSPNGVVWPLVCFIRMRLVAYRPSSTANNVHCKFQGEKLS